MKSKAKGSLNLFRWGDAERVTLQPESIQRLAVHGSRDVHVSIENRSQEMISIVKRQDPT